MIKTEELFFNNVHYKYLRYGNGAKNIICIHGFDQDTSIFNPLTFLFNSSEYSVYSIGLVFHESIITSDLKNVKPIKVHELVDFIKFFCESLHIVKYNLVGFSMGARLSIVIATKASNKPDKILLLAPDGIVVDKYYKILTTPLGNKIFNMIAKNSFFKITVEKIVRLYTIADKNKYKISEYAFKDEKRLEKISNTWMYYSKIKVDIIDFLKVLRTTGIRVKFVFGQYDKIIKISSIDKIKAYSQSAIDYEILKEGHDLLKSQYMKKYKDYLE